MKKGFLKKNKIFNINLLYILSLIPVVIYGFWKNGYLMYKHDYMTLFKSTQYLVIPVVIIVLSYVFEIYYYLGIKKEDNLDHAYNTIVPYANVLCYLVCGPMDKLYITIPIIIVLDIILKLTDEQINVNQVALFKVLLFVALTIMGSYNNANLYERSLSISFESVEYFMGRGIGEIGTTSALFVLIGFIILLFNKYYKKDIAISSLLSYILVSLIVYFVGGVKLSNILLHTFSSGFLFASLFVATFSNCTPVVKGGRILYGICVGMLSAILVNILHFYVGIYILILVLGIATPLFNKFKVDLD